MSALRAITGLAASLSLFCAPAALAQSLFSDWAAVVVAGDSRSGDDKPTETFDNARRDIAQALVEAGFSADNLRQFSVNPERYPDQPVLKSDGLTVFRELQSLTARATGGCLLYFTSHGVPQGVLVGDGLVSPGLMARAADEICGQKPTVVVVSACYSGVFVPALAGPNRAVLTAARPDRSSFGCGESDVYPYFDACLLEGMPQAADFVALARSAQTCVARKETEQGLSPPSEPQFAAGGAIRPMLPLYSFDR